MLLTIVFIHLLTMSQNGKVLAADLIAAYRIIGGTETTIQNHPYVVSIQKTYHLCGGSIIAPKYVLTAAHCFHGSKNDLSRYSIIAGLTNIKEKREDSVFEIGEVQCHSAYNPVNQDNDICLLKIKKEFKFSETVQPIKLPTKSSKLKDGDSVTVCGWGQTDAHDVDSSPNILNTVDVTIIDYMKCSKAFSKTIMEVTKNMICAGDQKQSRDACFGDSGGPLSMKNKESEPVLVGIVSWGIGCGEIKYPGVYANVQLYLNWIEEITSK